MRVTRGDNTETMITVVECGSLWATGYVDGNYAVTVYFLALGAALNWTGMMTPVLIVLSIVLDIVSVHQ